MQSAAMHTLIGTVKLKDVDPQAWLADVLGRIAESLQSQFNQMLSWGWGSRTETRLSRISQRPPKTSTPLKLVLRIPAVFS